MNWITSEQPKKLTDIIETVVRAESHTITEDMRFEDPKGELERIEYIIEFNRDNRSVSLTCHVTSDGAKFPHRDDHPEAHVFSDGPESFYFEFYDLGLFDEASSEIRSAFEEVLYRVAQEAEDRELVIDFDDEDDC